MQQSLCAAGVGSLEPDGISEKSQCGNRGGNGDSENGRWPACVQANADSLVMVRSGLERHGQGGSVASAISGSPRSFLGRVNPVSHGAQGGFRSVFCGRCDKMTHSLPRCSILAQNLKRKWIGLSELAALGHLLWAIEEQWCETAGIWSRDCSGR